MRPAASSGRTSPHHSLDVQQLLRELAERGSLTAVATAVHVSPAAVSQRLSALPRTVPTPLTEKRGRRLALTPAGHARQSDVAAALDRAERAVPAHQESLTVPARITAFHSAALAWLALLLHAVGPAGGPPVHCSDSDVAQPQFPRLVADHDLVVAHLLLEPMHVALAVEHPLDRRAELGVADGAGLRWISVHDGYPLAGALEAVAVAARRPPDVVHRIHEFFVAADFVATGDAVALLPASTTCPDARVALRPMADLAVHRSIDVLARPETVARAPAKPWRCCRTSPRSERSRGWVDASASLAARRRPNTTLNLARGAGSRFRWAVSR